MCQPSHTRHKRYFPLIIANDVSRIYRRGQHEVRAVDGVSLEIARGEFTAVVGASGSGKTTLLNLLAGLDTPTAGDILVHGHSLTKMSRRELARHRARHVGMVFQSFNLLPHQTALKNVELSLYFDETPRQEREGRARGILERLGLSERLTHRPADLSGGEQQRVAMARALVKRPEILLADEPTGNLDEDNSQIISKLLKELNAEGITVIIVTHDQRLAASIAQRTIRMEYGHVISDTATDDGPFVA